ncbi:hypothetical protein CAOG_005917 [Capsaspora owczarzaki ATCC 30864]|uniref:CSN8/PSMD8/EIF3K domain-containing protein n=2 Tax=Capsaspora owczarzaki (strain ATCC 30864) TaxID=595528 RepID=A0A0D2X455_CAPO3|nr:hypothetical protein CAOG_005917 [Capsaspora owczarzaki ATCC 30864]
MTIANANALLSKLRGEWTATKPNHQLCGDLLIQLKIALTELSFLPTAGVQSAEELLLAREVLEIGALHSIAVGDFAAFDRYAVQLRTYYFDYAAAIPTSSQRSLLLGLHLLRLLSQQQIGDFHVALERLNSVTLTSDPFVRFPIALEQHIMEGLDHQVFAAVQNVPHPSYVPFMEQLLQTLRSNAESDKLKLSVGDARKLAAKIELHDYSAQVIQNALGYAKELERIV